MAKAVFFDLDGTLVDSNEFHVLAWAEAIDLAHLRAARSALRDEIGKGADKLIPALFPGLSSLERKLLGQGQGNIFKRRYLCQVRPFPYAHALLSRLHRARSQIYLVSSASRVEVDHYAKLLGVADIVSGIVTIDDANQSKPAPELFVQALQLTAGLDPKDVLVVGDTPYDIEAAAKCGIATLAVRSGGFSDHSLKGALSISLDVQELLECFDDTPLSNSDP